MGQFHNRAERHRSLKLAWNWYIEITNCPGANALKLLCNLFPSIASEALAWPVYGRYYIKPDTICAAQLVGLIAAFAMDWCTVLFTEHLPSIICQWQKQANPGHKGARRQRHSTGTMHAIHSVTLCKVINISYRCHDMKTFSVLLALPEGIHRWPWNSQHIGRSLADIFAASLIKLLHNNLEDSELTRLGAHTTSL